MTVRTQVGRVLVAAAMVSALSIGAVVAAVPATAASQDGGRVSGPLIRYDGGDSRWYWWTTIPGVGNSPSLDALFTSIMANPGPNTWSFPAVGETGPVTGGGKCFQDNGNTNLTFVACDGSVNQTFTAAAGTAPGAPNVLGFTLQSNRAANRYVIGARGTLVMTIGSALTADSVWALESPLTIVSPAEDATVGTSGATFTGTATPDVTVTITDAGGETVGSALADSTGQWSIDAVLPEGAASLTVTSGTNTASLNLLVIDDGASLTTSTITAAPTSITTEASSSSQVTVALADADGTPLTTGGDTIIMTTTLGTIGPVTDNGDGTYTATLTGAGPAGTATIGFTIDGATATATTTVEITPGPPSTTTSTINANPANITPSGSSTITVATADAFGNPLSIGGAAVTMTATLGSLSEVTDNGDGTYTATLTGDGTDGEATIGFAIDGEAAPATALVAITSASALASTITATPTTLIADGTSTARITVTLTDDDGQQLSDGGDIVTIVQQPATQTTAQTLALTPTTQATSTAAAPTISAVVDNGDGTYTATLTAPAQPGTIILGFTIDGTLALNTTSVTFTPAATVLPSLKGTTTTVLADTGISTTPLTGAALAALILTGLTLITINNRHRKTRHDHLLPVDTSND